VAWLPPESGNPPSNLQPHVILGTTRCLLLALLGQHTCHPTPLLPLARLCIANRTDSKPQWQDTAPTGTTRRCSAFSSSSKSSRLALNNIPLRLPSFLSVPISHSDQDRSQWRIPRPGTDPAKAATASLLSTAGCPRPVSPPSPSPDCFQSHNSTIDRYPTLLPQAPAPIARSP